MLSKENKILTTMAVTIGRLAGYGFLDEFEVNCIKVTEEAYEYFQTQKSVEYFELINAHRIALWYALSKYGNAAGKNFLQFYFDECLLKDLWTPEEI